MALERFRRKFSEVEITHLPTGKRLQTLIDEQQTSYGSDRACDDGDGNAYIPIAARLRTIAKDGTPSAQPDINQSMSGQRIFSQARNTPATG